MGPEIRQLHLGLGGLLLLHVHELGGGVLGPLHVRQHAQKGIVLVVFTVKVTNIAVRHLYYQ
jgi:hypothetical protein